MIRQMPAAATRLSYALIGAIAGLSAWALLDLVPELIENTRVVLFLVASGLGFLSVLLALLGPLSLIPALAAALVMALPAAGLLLWASFRHAEFDGFYSGTYWLPAYIYLLAVAVPFVVAGLERRGGWRDYGLLFDAAWALVVRIAAAWLFVAIVWGVLLLSNALLELVGLHVIDDLLKIDAAPWFISGIALGLGLAIVHELRDVVSPFLAIQLLRVLLPALLVVLGVFIVALPFRGLGNLFGHFSAATILLMVTIAGFTLVTTAIHRDDAQSVQGEAMRGAAWALSLMLPVPAALALWAVWLRVQQYGLTPDRVAALVAAGLILVYALAYAGAVVRGDMWRARQRRVNRWMALLTLAVAVAWLTPALNAERLSVASQIARAVRGAPAENLALWEMANTWGVAGTRGLALLETHARAEKDSALLALIDKARQIPQKGAYIAARDDADIPSLSALVPLRPEGASLPPGALDALPGDERRMIRDACQRRAPGGHPGCVMVVARFEPEGTVEQAIGFFIAGGSNVRVLTFEVQNGALISAGYPRDLGTGEYPAMRRQIVTDILEGRYQIAPAPRNVLDVGGMRLFPQN